MTYKVSSGTLNLCSLTYNFGWDSAPDQTPTGELTALSRPPAGFRGPTSKVRGGKEKGGGGMDGSP